MPWTDVVMAWAAVATAVFTLGLLITAICAIKPAKETWKAAAEANRQAERDSREQSRPYVTAQIVPGLAGITGWDLRIMNTGRTAARNLTMDYDRWPTKDEGDGEPLETWDIVSRSVHAMFTTPRTLAPGASLRVVWLLERGPTESVKHSDPPRGLGRTGVISLSYGSDDPKAPIYNDSFEVMIENAGLWPVPEDGPEPPSDLGEVANRADTLMRVLIRRLGELGR